MRNNGRMIINVEDVKGVLIGGTWHKVVPDSFELVEYQIRQDNRNGVGQPGAAFHDADVDEIVIVPLNRIQAYQWNSPDA